MAPLEESDERGDTVNYRGEKKLMQLIYVRRSVLAVTISILLICLPMYSGERAPDLKRSGEPKWGKPNKLFNGKDLSGWTPSDPNATATWKVENGTLVSPGRGPELITNAKFQDFKLHIEFNCARGSNSGM